jgi:hypothetical protein
MKKILITLLLSIVSLSAFAADLYNCESIQEVNPRGTEELVIKRSLFGNKIKRIELINELSQNMEQEENPFLTSFAGNFRIDPHSLDETKNHTFKKMSKRQGLRGETAIVLSQSLINGEDVGFASYYSHSCMILSCSTYSYFFKCFKL